MWVLPAVLGLGMFIYLCLLLVFAFLTRRYQTEPSLEIVIVVSPFVCSLLCARPSSKVFLIRSSLAGAKKNAKPDCRFLIFI